MEEFSESKRRDEGYTDHENTEIFG